MKVIGLGFVVNILTQFVQLYLIYLLALQLNPLEFTLLNQWIFLAGFIGIFFNFRSDFLLVSKESSNLHNRYIASLLITLLAVALTIATTALFIDEFVLLFAYAGALGVMKVSTNYLGLSQKYLYYPLTRLISLSIILWIVYLYNDGLNVFLVYTLVFSCASLSLLVASFYVSKATVHNFINFD